jgi:hypothetical protein
MKKAIRKIIVFIGLLGCFLIFYIACRFLFSGYHFSLHLGGSSVTTWLDTNANGIKEEGEPPFPRVCLWKTTNIENRFSTDFNPCQSEAYQNMTDADGQWNDFLPYGSCKEEYIFVFVPKGYQPTTDLASNGCSAQFGFVEAGRVVTHKIVTAQEFIQRHVFWLWVKRVAIALTMLGLAILGTIWLEKPTKLNSHEL